jgi:hypothetical protein
MEPGEVGYRRYGGLNFWNTDACLIHQVTIERIGDVKFLLIETADQLRRCWWEYSTYKTPPRGNLAKNLERVEEAFIRAFRNHREQVLQLQHPMKVGQFMQMAVGKLNNLKPVIVS